MSEVKVDSEEYKRWYNSNGELHREDGPAVEYTNGDKYWYINGKLHRIDGPAIEYNNKHKLWYINGKKHREDGPAFEYAGGYKSWYIDGKLHRVDGPAIDNINGHKEWWIDGKRHRIDGPAVEWSSGHEEWWINNDNYMKEQFDEIVNFPDKEIPYVVFNNSIYHIMLKDGVGIRLSYILELYIDGEYIKWDWSLGEVILSFLCSSEYIEPLLDWIQENGRYFPSEFIGRLYY
jgi:hypothetical protein